MNVDLQCGIDEQGVRFISGRIDGVATVPCQRCLQDMRLSLTADMVLGLIVSPAEEEYLPDPYDALLVENRTLSLAGIVEDELLLRAPIVAMHESPDCHGEINKSDGRHEDEQDVRENPFAMLARLKKD